MWFSYFYVDYVLFFTFKKDSDILVKDLSAFRWKLRYSYDAYDKEFLEKLCIAFIHLVLNAKRCCARFCSFV